MVPLANRPGKAYLLTAKDKALEVTAGENGLTIRVPAEAPDKIASVLALELDGKPEPFAHHIRPAADGTLALNAADAEIEGSAKLEEKGGGQNIGFWLDPKTTVYWNVEVPAGEYNVELQFAAETGSDGNQFNIVAGDQALSAALHATGAWDKFTTVQLGKLNVPAGAKTITVKPTKTFGPVMNLRQIKLTKAG